MPIKSDTPLSIALQLAGLGWSVLPVCWPKPDGSSDCPRGHDKKNSGKAPMTPNGAKNATTDTAAIERWWAKWPSANVGVALAPSGLVAIDCDSEAAIHEAFKLGLTPTLCRVSRWPAYVFQATVGTPKTNRTHWGESHKLDILGGGYLVVHGTHQTGRDIYLEGDGLSAVPKWAVDALTESSQATSEPEQSASDDPPVTLSEDGSLWWNGQLVVKTDGTVGKRVSDTEEIDRSTTLFHLAMALRDGNASRVTIETALAERDAALGYRKYTERGDKREYQRIAKKVYLESPPGIGGIQVNSYDDENGGGVSGDNSGFPTLSEQAYHGLAGEIVRAIEPDTEADPTAILLNVLVYFGNAAGRSLHTTVEADRHGTNLFVVQVGETSKARKGTAKGHADKLFRFADAAWVGERVKGGLSSGEGLTWHVRDGDAQEADTDRRLLAYEPEFAAVLKVLSRDGNTLSSTLRQAWDNGTLHILTKNNPIRATAAHISVLAHVTKEDLLRYLTETEAGNGFGNRFLWAAVKRSKLLPEGGKQIDYGPLGDSLRKSLAKARKMGEITRDDSARALWREKYPELSEGRPGLFGSLTARGEAQVTRLSLLYAALDQSSRITEAHLSAALALWDYCRESARYIFGDALGDAVADTILAALRRSGPLSRTDISKLFQGNQPSRRIDDALTVLEKRRLARGERAYDTGGRPVETWTAI